MQLFQQGKKLKEGEMIVQVITQEKFLSLRHLHVKRTKNEKIDYPLITLAALKDQNKIKIAFSGLYEYPLRCSKIENAINNQSIPLKEKVNNIINNLSGEILHDLGGTSEYRKFMLHTMLCEAIKELKEDC